MNRRGEPRMNIKFLVGIGEKFEGEISSIFNKLGWN